MNGLGDMGIIDVNHLKFKYSEELPEILKDITFNVQQGEWLAIVGHNGSGKSTLAKLVDGLLEPESGEIKILGETLTDNNVWQLRENIGLVFQNPDNQFVGATVADDVAFGMENRAFKRETMQSRVKDALSQVGMTGFEAREPGSLSGGQNNESLLLV